MKKEELDKLLNKYYNGESTEDDENVLKTFFSGNEVPEGYEAEVAIFSFYKNASGIPEPSSDFESRILAAVDVAENSKRLSGKFRRLIYPSISIAAGILIIVATWFFFNKSREPRDTFTDPELAYAETIKILEVVSSQLNKGTRALEPVSRINAVSTKSFETISKTQKMVEKNLRNLDYLNKAFEIVNSPLDKTR